MKGAMHQKQMCGFGLVCWYSTQQTPLYVILFDPVRLDNTNLNCLLYADDLVLLSESQKGLQSCLTKLERYTNRWKLNINKKKTKILVIGTPAQRRTYATTNWVFDSNALEHVNEYCYLSIIINSSGTFKKALKALHNKALRAYHCLFIMYQLIYC